MHTIDIYVSLDIHVFYKLAIKFLFYIVYSVHCAYIVNSVQVHNNAAQTLCDIIRLSREPVSQLQEPVEPSALLTTIEL